MSDDRKLIALYDWVRDHKPALVDEIADAIATVDAKQWGIQKANEDHPHWKVYATYGDAIWCMLHNLVRQEVKKRLGVDIVGREAKPPEYPPVHRWVMQGQGEDRIWTTWTIVDTEVERDGWLKTKRREDPDIKWRAVLETRTYTAEDL